MRVPIFPGPSQSPPSATPLGRCIYYYPWTNTKTSCSPEVQSLCQNSRLKSLGILRVWQMYNGTHQSLQYQAEDGVTAPKLFHLSPLTAGNHWSFSCHHSFAFSRMSSGWNVKHAALPDWLVSLGNMHFLDPAYLFTAWWLILFSAE